MNFRRPPCRLYSTIRRTDLIVVMEKGKIIETGTHDELLAHSGKYKRL